MAVALLTLLMALQHVFLPFEPDWQHIAYRFLSSVPAGLVFALLYLRQRRLLPLHVIHWLGNVVGVAMLFLAPRA